MDGAATELMLGNTMTGARVKDARAVWRYLAARPDVDPARMALWGDSFADVNPPVIAPYESLYRQLSPRTLYQAEPMGPLVALLAALYEDRVRAVATRGGLVSFASALEDRFCYLPLDVVVPGILQVADLPAIAGALAPKPVLEEAPVDGLNRAVRRRPLPAAWARGWRGRCGRSTQWALAEAPATGGGYFSTVTMGVVITGEGVLEAGSIPAVITFAPSMPMARFSETSTPDPISKRTSLPRAKRAIRVPAATPESPPMPIPRILPLAAPAMPPICPAVAAPSPIFLRSPPLSASRVTVPGSFICESEPPGTWSMAAASGRV